MNRANACTGAKLSVQLLNEMRRRKQKYGVMMIPLRRERSCVGTGHPPSPCCGGRWSAASVFELLN